MVNITNSEDVDVNGAATSGENSNSNDTYLCPTLERLNSADASYGLNLAAASALDRNGDENGYKSKFLRMLKPEKASTSKEPNTTYYQLSTEFKSLQQSLTEEKTWLENNGDFRSSFLDGQTTQNFVRQMNNFYEEMAGRVNTLKSSAALSRSDDIYELFEQTSSYDMKKHLRQVDGNEDATSEIVEGARQAKKAVRNSQDLEKINKFKNAISKLDLEIKQSQETLDVEKAERLTTQKEMCAKIYMGGKYMDKNTQLFLDLCSFERASKERRGDTVSSPEATRMSKRHKVGKEADPKAGPAKDFIKKNIELAKEGMMASCALTDEEKRKLEEILVDLDELDVSEGCENRTKEQAKTSTKMEAAIPIVPYPSISHIIGEEDEKEDGYNIEADGTDASVEAAGDGDDISATKNAFLFEESDRKRLQDINALLCDFNSEYKNLVKKRADADYGKRYWKEGLLEVNLKEVNTKLEYIGRSFSEAEDELQAEKETYLRERHRAQPGDDGCEGDDSTSRLVEIVKELYLAENPSLETLDSRHEGDDGRLYSIVKELYLREKRSLELGIIDDDDSSTSDDDEAGVDEDDGGNDREKQSDESMEKGDDDDDDFEDETYSTEDDGSTCRVDVMLEKAVSLLDNGPDVSEITY